MKNWIKIFIIILCLFAGPSFFSFLIKEEPKPTPNNEGVVAKVKRVVDTSNWNEYINTQLGFSIKIPPETQGLDRCGGSKESLVPVKIFQDNSNNAVYITPEYYHDYRNEKCEKIEASLASLQAQGNINKPFTAWKIDVVKINNLDDIKKFIDDYYHNGCIYGSQQLNKDGLYDIYVTDDGKTTDENGLGCPGEMHYKILYSPERQKMISVKLSIDYDFFLYEGPSGGFENFDQEMVKSLKFE
ncbi:MAG: hypothetical protein WA092_02625 [Minisyncoccales bacterium]